MQTCQMGPQWDTTLHLLAWLSLKKKKKKRNNVRKDVKILEPSYNPAMNIKWYVHWGKQFDNSSKSYT